MFLNFFLFCGLVNFAQIARVRFDAWRCVGRSYRVASVDQNGTLALWEVSPETLRPPVEALRLRRRASLLVSQELSAPELSSLGVMETLANKDGQSQGQGQDKGQGQGEGQGEGSSGRVVVAIPTPKWSESCTVEPLTKHSVSQAPCSDVVYLSGDCCVVSSWGGYFSFFVQRPFATGAESTRPNPTFNPSPTHDQ